MSSIRKTGECASKNYQFYGRNRRNGSDAGQPMTSRGRKLPVAGPIGRGEAFDNPRGEAHGQQISGNLCLTAAENM